VRVRRDNFGCLPDELGTVGSAADRAPPAGERSELERAERDRDGEGEPVHEQRGAAPQMKPPRNRAEALPQLEIAERELLAAEAALIQSAEANGAPPEHLEYLRRMFRETTGRALH